MTPSNAWNTLDSAVNIYSESDREDLAVKRALQDAVMAYAASRPHQGQTPQAPVASSGAVFGNYGKTKGQPVAGAAKGDLEYYRQGCIRTLDDPSKERFHDKERVLLAAIDAELAK